jgi:hypothetical protein
MPPHMCLKKGICKHSDAERVRRNSPKNLQNLIKAVCDDWEIPVIPTTFISRPSADYYGMYTQTFLKPCKGIKKSFHNIVINSVAFYEVVDSRTPFFQRKQLISTILHELSHYIQVLMCGYTDHSSEFYTIYETLVANNYTNKLVEVE